MLNANRFDLIPADKPANRPQADPKRSAKITRLLLTLAMLAVTLWQAPEAALAQDSPAGETVTEQDAGQDPETTASEDVAKAEKPAGLDKRIDEAFGGATSWFVKGIFAGVPIIKPSKEYVEKYFTDRDKNGDGILEGDEIESVDQGQFDTTLDLEELIAARISTTLTPSMPSREDVEKVFRRA